MLDQHRIARAGVCGAAGTFFMSGAVSIIASAVDHGSLPGWAWWVLGGFTVIGATFLGLAWWFWVKGVNPRPPSQQLEFPAALPLVDRIFPDLGDVDLFTNAFLQDARNGRQKVWGRLGPNQSVYEIADRRLLFPLVFIPPEYWTAADIDWLNGETDPEDNSQPVYKGLVVSKLAFKRTLLIDKFTKRFKR